MLTFRPLNHETWNDLQILFGEKGACGGCWCMYWRLPNKIYEASKGHKNKEALYNLIVQNHSLGVIAFQDDLPIGWCSIAPKTALGRVASSRLLRCIEMLESVWSITCLYIGTENRRKGLSSKLIIAASEFAFKNGASMIEAYPILPKKENIPSVFAWVGFVKSFEAAGFTVLTQLSETRVAMRLFKL